MSIFGIPDLKLSPLLGIFGFGGSGLNRAAIAGSKHLQFAFPASTTTEQDGDYTVVRFNASQTISVLNYALSGPDNNVDVFVVAGGGNGGGGPIPGRAGGGGAGGVVDRASLDLQPLPQSIPVGVGGAAGASNFGPLVTVRGGPGGNGGTPTGGTKYS